MSRRIITITGIIAGDQVVILDGTCKGRLGDVEVISAPRPHKVQPELSIEAQTHVLVRLRDPGKPRSWRPGVWVHSDEIEIVEKRRRS